MLSKEHLTKSVGYTQSRLVSNHYLVLLKDLKKNIYFSVKNQLFKTSHLFQNYNLECLCFFLFFLFFFCPIVLLPVPYQPHLVLQVAEEPSIIFLGLFSINFSDSYVVEFVSLVLRQVAGSLQSCAGRVVMTPFIPTRRYDVIGPI